MESENSETTNPKIHHFVEWIKMEKKIKKISPSHYKVVVIDSQGKPKKIIVFSDNVPRNAHGEGEFAKLIFYSKDKIRIHSDDSIRVIKKKIIHEIGIDEISYDEIYCFINVTQYLDAKDVYDSSIRATKHFEEENEDNLNATSVEQILINVCNSHSLHSGEFSITYRSENVRRFSNFSSNDLTTASQSIDFEEFSSFFEEDNIYTRSIPLGQRIESYTNNGDFLVPSNPFLVSSLEYLKIPMVYLDNELLLNYGEPNNKIIYVCLAEDVFSHIKEVVHTQSEGQSEELIVESYGDLYTNRFFPFLYKNEKTINSLETLRERKTQIISKNKNIINKDVLLLYRTIDSFHKIYQEDQTGYDVDKMQTQIKSEGIKEFQLRIKRKNNAKITTLPLDVLFKNIHANSNIPLIKFNPGMRRENIYRIHTKQRTLNGKYISYLPENQVIKLSKTIGKHRGIFIYIKPQQQSSSLQYVETLDDKNEYEFYMIIHPNGDINVHSIFHSPVSNQELLHILQKYINPVIKDMNIFLNKTGYSIDVINSLYQPSLDIFYIKYMMEVDMKTNFIIKEHASCISTVFTILDNKLAKDGSLSLLFKRVENFQEMEQQFMLITELLKKTDNISVVIDGLMTNFKLSEDAAQLKLVEYYNEHPDARGKIVENVGFPVSIETQSLDRKVVITVDNIISLKYLENLHIYLYSLLKIAFTPKNKRTPELTSMKDLCRKLSVKKIDTDKSHVENVVSTSHAVATESAIPPRIPQPIQMIMLQEQGDENEDILSQGVEKFDEEDVIKKIKEGEEDEEEEGFFFDYEYENDNDDNDEEDAGEDVEEEKGGGKNDKSPEEEEEGTEEDNDDAEAEDTEAEDTEEEEEEEDTEEEFNILPIGKKLKNPNIFHERLKQRDPILFLTKEGEQDKYSRLCQSNIKRQPVVLSKSEFDKINRENPGSYTEYIKYGSRPENENYYICPRYWCLISNTSMTEEDVIAGKCAKQGKPDKIIPADADSVPKDAFVYEFSSNKEHIDNKGNYIKHYPGLSKSGTQFYPCCFKKPKKNVKMNDEPEETVEPTVKSKKIKPTIEPKISSLENEGKPKHPNRYIISNETFPIKYMHRYGFLPFSVQSFFQYNNYNCISKNNPAHIKPDTECILRYSIEQKPNQSILGFFADLYANTQGLTQTPSVDEFKQILISKISLDKYIRYNNSYLISVFRPPNHRNTEENVDISKYEDTELYKSIDMNNDYQVKFLEDTISSFENFLQYLSSDDAKIDHTYLWDIITDDNDQITKGGINLIILEITDNDITDNISVLCPTNSQFKRIFDPRKRSSILIKYGEYYEPLCLYKEVDGEIKVTKTFLKITAMKNIHRILELIERTTVNGCRNLPSMPNVYKFKQAIALNVLFVKLKTMNYTILKQITNYQGKVIGLLTKHGNKVSNEEYSDSEDANEHSIFVPCSPSAKIKELDDVPSVFVDNDNENLWNNYQTTIDELMKINTESKNSIPCSPKLKVLEDGLIIGIITETNQFIQIEPPSENIYADNYPTINSSNYFIADREINTSRKQDEEREKIVLKINAETQFYYLFRSIIRELVNRYENRNIKKKIKEIHQNPYVLYSNKIKKYVEYLKRLVGSRVSFVEMEEEVVLDIGELSCFSKNGDCSEENKKSYCVQKDDGECSLMIPSKHLLMPNLNNETIYYHRIADELLRNNRIRLFMTEPENYLNITDNEYKVNDDEFILLQSTLQTDYLKSEPAYNTSKYIHNINYDTAEPQITQRYSTDAISLEKQGEMLEERETVTSNLNDNILECIVSTREVIGNQLSLWKRIFTKYDKENKEKTKEVVFKNNIGNCTFYILIYIFQSFYKKTISLHSLKISLINGYKKYWPKYSRQIVKTLKNQGKEQIAKKIKEDNLEEIILDQNYYLTDFDVWIFSDIAELQICIFNPNKLRGTNLEWRIMGDKYDQPHFFIRSGAFIRANKPSSYHLITPTFILESLPEFYKIVQNAITGRSSQENTVSLEKYLSEVV
jgi:hypothetical protein